MSRSVTYTAICMIVRQRKCLCSATYSVLYTSFIHSVDLSEFISSCDYMFGFRSVCLISGMSFDHFILIFDIFPVSIDYIGSTVFVI